MLSSKAIIRVFAILVILSAVGCVTTQEKLTSGYKAEISHYAGAMVDAHAHLLPSVASIDNVVIFLDQAKIGRAVLFAGEKDLRNAKKKFPDRVIPFLMPLRGDPATGELLVDNSILTKIEKQIASGFFKVIGEVPLRLHKIRPYPKGIHHSADSLQMRKLYDIAAKYNVPVNVHVDQGYTDEIERALEHNRNTTIHQTHFLINQISKDLS